MNTNNNFSESNINLINELTSKEKDILYHIANGLTNKEISKQLFLSPLTIRNYIVKIFSKLQVSNRAEAAKIATLAEISSKTNSEDLQKSA